MALINVENLTKRYGQKDAEILALNHVSLSVEEGEFLSIMGASGSGKSTLLNLMGGLDTPTEGRVLYDGENIFDMDDEALSGFRLENIGFIFQSYNLIPELSVRENILLPSVLAGRKDSEEQMKKVSKMLGLDDRLEHLPWQLSGGQQQRAAIARALMNRPKVLLCDEPTGNLDKNSGSNVMSILCELNKKHGITIIMITHDPVLAKETTRILNISDGIIVK